VTPRRRLSVGGVSQAGGRNLEVGQTVSVDALTGDDPHVGKLLDERTNRVAGQVTGAKQLSRSARRIKAVVAIDAKPFGFVF